MAMVVDALGFLSLTPEDARVVGTVAIVIFLVLDVLASQDDVPGNTPREWLVRLMLWRSLGFWNTDNRAKARASGGVSPLLVPFQYLPMTGAPVPFLFVALVGHFFHPWSSPPVEVGDWGLVLVLGLGFAIGVATYVSGAKRRRGELLVVWIAAAGLAAGMFLWPVGIQSVSP